MVTKCKEENCNKSPAFNYENKKERLYCSSHKKEGMINIVNKKCIAENCNKQPCFNLPNEKFGIYCNIHKKENMINVKDKKCLKENCNKIPSFNLPNENIGIYCKEHAKENMIDVKSKLCLECNKRPTFNLPNKKSGIYCFEHKKENMIDVKNKRCLEENCNLISPKFNLPNEKFGIYCNIHKKENMINVKDKKCLEENCNKIPSFNLPNEKIAIYCVNHKKENMVDVKSKRCLEENCNKQGVFNLPNEKNGIYCSEHRKKEMIDVKNKKCKECNDIQANYKYKDYCFGCFIYLFPNEKIVKNHRIKEKNMTDFIKSEFKDEKMTFDKQIIGGSSKRRPDVYIDKITHVIIGECDEHQHKDTSCEEIRLTELLKDIGKKPVVFIRFNPDSYINENGKKIPSSFKLDKTTGKLIIRDQKEFDYRLNVLKEYINKYLITIPEKDVTYEYLFYDNSLL
jgi:hypothetical protein